MTSQGGATTVNEVAQVDPKVAKQLLSDLSRPHTRVLRRARDKILFKSPIGTLIA